MLRIAIVLFILTGCFESHSTEIRIDAREVTGQERPWDLPRNDHFERWLRCMLPSDFQAAKVNPAWTQVAAASGQNCVGCHAYLADEQRFFDELKAGYTVHYYLYPVPKAPEAPLVVRINEQRLLSVASAQNPHAEHPRFDPTLAYPAMTDFIARTQARYDAQICGD